MFTKTTKAVTDSSYLLKQTVQIQTVHVLIVVSIDKKKSILYTLAKSINKSNTKYRVTRGFMQEEGELWNNIALELSRPTDVLSQLIFMATLGKRNKQPLCSN